MADKRVFLKVKLKSLAEEARMIKSEERKRKVRRVRGATCGNRTSDSEAACIQIRKASSKRNAARRAKDWYPMSAQELQELHRHRIDVVRVESRLSSIAYALVRGRELNRVDSLNGLEVRHIERVQAMLKKFGDLSDPVQKTFVDTKAIDVLYAMRASTLQRAA